MLIWKQHFIQQNRNKNAIQENKSITNRKMFNKDYSEYRRLWRYEILTMKITLKLPKKITINFWFKFGMIFSIKVFK